MTAVEQFAYAGITVRTVLVDGEPWFVLADICRVLNIGNPSAVASRLDDDEKGLNQIETPGGAQSVGTVNESGMYSVILRSDKPQAKEFRRWVTGVVLPEIRRTGQFGSALPSNFAEALELAAVEVRRAEALEAKVAADAPKVEAFDALMDSDGFYSMEAVAKIIGGIGRNTLYSRLRDLGIIRRGSRLPYQQYAHHFKIVAGTRPGSDVATETTRVRPSGLPFILKKLGVTAEVAS